MRPRPPAARHRSAPALAALAALLTAAAACSPDRPTGPEAPRPTTVVVTLSFDSLFIGDSAAAEARVLDQLGAPMPDQPVTWSSGAPAVATVSADGMVRALAAGSATIRASVTSASDVAGEAAFDVVGVWVAMADLLDGELTVEPNPSGRAPLAAAVRFRTTRPTLARSTVRARNPADALSFTESEDPSLGHLLPVVGLYPDARNLVEIVVATDSLRAADTVFVATGPLPGFLPTVIVHAAERSAMEPGWTLASLSIGAGSHFESWPFMFDAAGDVRWYLDLSWLGEITFAVEPLADGNLITGEGSAIYEFDWLGSEVRAWPIPGYLFHHDVIEKEPSGNLIAAVDKEGLATVEDHVIEIDRRSGAVVREWDLRPILDTARTSYVESEADWFHMNSVWYDARDGSLLLSGRNQTAVAKVSADNRLVWILGPHRGWRAPWSDRLLTAVDAGGRPYADDVQEGSESPGPEFRWSWGQHAAMYLPDGHVFLFDNGLARNWSAEGLYFSRGVEYAVDEDRMTVRQVWQYGEARGEPFYSEIISDVDLLPVTGNRLISPGLVQELTAARVTEVTHPGATVVFDAEIVFARAFASGTAWGQFDLVYRAERVGGW